MPELLGFLRQLIIWYIWILVIAAVLSWLIAFNVVNTRNRFVYTVSDFLYRITEPAIRPIRRRVPPINGIDLSALILIIILWFITDVVFVWLYRAFA